MKHLFLLFLLTGSLLSSFADPEGEELAKRQCRSVHMNFQSIPPGSSALYIEATALQSANGTYFCASNFNDGYIGFQEKADGNKWVIFSIWDPVGHGDNPQIVPEEERTKLVDRGKDTVTGRFGGEGTGGQSFFDYEWKIGEKMKFLVIKKPVGEKFKQISGYFFNNKKNKWEFISCWKTHSKKEEFSGSASFIEDFRRNYESAKIVRKAVYGPVFAYTPEGKWQEARKGGFTADPTPSDAIYAGIDSKLKGFILQTGGDTKTDPDFKLWSSKEYPETLHHALPGKDVEALIKAPLMEEKNLPDNRDEKRRERREKERSKPLSQAA